MKVLIVGLGSMGKRRIRLIQQIDKKCQIIGVDAKSERRIEAEQIFRIKTVRSLEEAFQKEYNYAFVCTSPLSHADIIEACLKQNIHVFTEINLIDDKYDSNMRLAEEKNKVLFLSSTFLYRDEIKYIRDSVSNSKSILSYTYHVGQYLPDWHPWENYMGYFVGDVRTNGCREIMAIDFPWLYKTFGEIVDIHIKKGKKTKLKTTFPDSYLLLVEHAGGVQGTIMIDVVSRKAVRNFELYGEDLYLTWNGSPQGLSLFDFSRKEEQFIQFYDQVDKQDRYTSFIVENAYKNEIIAFFNQVEGKQQPEYTFDDDKYVLTLIDTIEKRY